MPRSDQRRRPDETRKNVRERSAAGVARSDESRRPKSGLLALFSGKARWICLMLVLADVLVYWPVTTNGFVSYDDPGYVIDNPHINHGLTREGVAWAFSLAGHGANWHPLTSISHMLDVQLFGLRPGPHHVVNALLHILSTTLLFGLLFDLTGAVGRSGFVAALFGVHPLHVESVAWIAERKDVLSALFFVLTLWAYAWYTRKPGTKRYLTVVCLFALGLMAKPMLVTLPFVLILLDVWPLRRVSQVKLGRLAAEKVPLLVMAIASSVVTLFVQQRSGAAPGLEVLSIQERIANAFVAYVAYVAKMVWPFGLAAYYPYDETLPLWKVLSAALFLVLVTVAVIQGLKRAPYLATGWFWYLGTLIPVIGLIQVGGQPMADRYTYIPLIGLSLMVAWGAADLKARFALNRMVLPTLAIAVTVGCAALARVQVGYWKDTLTLWTHALAVTRGNYYAHGNLGHALLDLGKLDEALAQYGESLRLRPAAADVHGGMAIALDRQGKGAEAIPHYREALRFKPAYAEGHNNLGVALARQGKTDEAVSHYREAVRLRPDYADAHNNLGSAFAKTGNTAEAIREFREALRLKPDPDVYYNLGAMYEASGDLGQARRSYEAALQLAPQNPHARGALDQLNSSGASR